MQQAERSDPNSQRFQILSFDGGGLKGLFAAAVLAEVESQLGVSVVDSFDLVAGTSTGGLIALALGIGLSPAEIVEFYASKGPSIFGSPGTIRRFWRSKYESANLRSALTDVFGDRTLSSSTKRLLIPAYSLDANDVYVFKTRHHERLTRDHTERMVDVAMATSAAPTYLPAHLLGNRRLVDGGLWANNPTLIAVAEARSMLNVALDDIYILSMGATEEVTSLGSDLDRGGYRQWALRGVPTMLRAQALGSFHAAEHLVGADNIVRVDAPVPSGLFKLDKLDVGRVRGLAETLAGHVCPQIRPFTEHHAPTFTHIP